jgi:hypothetical protein
VTQKQMHSTGNDDLESMLLEFWKGTLVAILDDGQINKANFKVCDMLKSFQCYK